MIFRVFIDKRGRIVIPKEVREAIGIKDGDEIILKVVDDKIVLEKPLDPFKVLERVFGDLSFDRELRRLAEKEAYKDLSGED